MSNAVVCQVGQQRHRHPRAGRLDHGTLELAEHLQVAQRIRVVRSGEIPVVEAQRLLEVDRVAASRVHAEEEGAVVDHVVAADQIRGVGQAPRMPVGSRLEQQGGGVDGAAGHDEPAGPDAQWFSVAHGDGLGDVPAVRRRVQPLHDGASEQPYRRAPKCRPDAAGLGIALGPERTGEAVAGSLSDAGAAGADIHADRHRERVQALGAHRSRQRGDRRLVLKRGERKVARAGRLGGIVALFAVYLIHALGLGVERLHLGVGDRPRRRDPVLMLGLVEVLASQARQAGSVDFGVAADVVVHPGLERPAGRCVVPLLGVLVATPLEDLDRRRVGFLARKEVAPFHDQHTCAAVPDRVGEGGPAHAGTDDRDVAVDGLDVDNCDDRRRSRIENTGHVSPHRPARGGLSRPPLVPPGPRPGREPRRHR